MRSYKELLEQNKMLLEERIDNSIVDNNAEVWRNKFNKLMKENQDLKVDHRFIFKICNELTKENQELKQEINDKIIDSKVEPVFICGGKGNGKSFFGSTEGQLFTENVKLKDTNADLINDNKTLRIMNNNLCDQMKEVEKRNIFLKEQNYVLRKDIDINIKSPKLFTTESYLKLVEKNKKLKKENETVLNDNIVLVNTISGLFQGRG